MVYTKIIMRFKGLLPGVYYFLFLLILWIYQIYCVSCCCTLHLKVNKKELFYSIIINQMRFRSDLIVTDYPIFCSMNRIQNIPCNAKLLNIAH